MVEYVTIQEAKKIVRWVFKNYDRENILPIPPQQDMKGKAYISQARSRCSVAFKYAGKRHVYIFYLDDRKKHQLPCVTPLVSFQTFGRYWKVPKIGNPIRARVRILSYMDPARANMWHENAVCYDVNKAYAAAFLGDLPDTTVEKKVKIIEEGEIGFGFLPDSDELDLLEVGDFSHHVFPAIRPEGIQKFIKRYTRKENDPVLTKRGKDMINFVTGQMQNWNIYVRAAIVCRARKNVERLMDGNTLYSNTDSIVSAVERNDIPLSSRIGDFKIERRGSFFYSGAGSYLWDVNGKRVERTKGKIHNTYHIDWDRGCIEKDAEGT